MNGWDEVSQREDLVAHAATLFQQCRPLFQALGDPAREDIILTLGQHGRLNVGQISARSPLSRPAVSHHLKVLRDTGLVTVEREGTENYYRLTAAAGLEQLKALISAVEQVCGR